MSADDVVDQAEADAGLSSLDLYAISVPNSEVSGRCPRRLDWEWLDVATGEVFPVRCRANFCPFCGPVNAVLLGGAIALAGIERMGTLTQVGNDWATIRARMKRLRYDLRQQAEVDWCWHVEPNPKGTGQHVHFFQRGDFIAQSELARLADKRGMGKVAHIQRYQAKRKAGEKGRVGYGLKLAGVKYGLKLAESEASMRTYLGVNGRRLVHASRGFWKDAEGETVGQREAMVAWAKQGPLVTEERELRLIRRVA